MSRTLDDLILGLVGVLTSEDMSYQVSRNRKLVKVDKKATKEYYRNNRNPELYNKLMTKLEYEILLLSYVMRRDDGVITGDEARLIKRQIDPHRVLMKREDIKRLKQITKTEHSPTDIIKFVQLKCLSDSEIERGFGLLEIMDQITGRYSGVIRQLRKQFNYHL